MSRYIVSDIGCLMTISIVGKDFIKKLEAYLKRLDEKWDSLTEDEKLTAYEYGVSSFYRIEERTAGCRYKVEFQDWDYNICVSRIWGDDNEILTVTVYPNVPFMFFTQRFPKFLKEVFDIDLKDLEFRRLARESLKKMMENAEFLMKLGDEE